MKEHLERNKWRYAIALGAFAGITFVIMKERCVTLLKGVNGPSLATTRSFSFSIFQNRSPQIVTTIHSGGRGHPGFRVRNLDHMIDFDTQGQAARAFGIQPHVLSGHLNGKWLDADGKRFIRIPA